MKNKKKNLQALVVVIVVGIGFLGNNERSVFHLSKINPVTICMENESVNADSLSTREKKLFLYTKKIITTGIQHLISNL